MHKDRAMSVARLTNTNLYLQRLGFDAPPPSTLDTLRQLQSRHTAQFVFENLATISAEPVLIDLVSIEDKVLQQGRGGYCYELNHLFYALLLELGFDARAISGRVVMNQPEGSWTASESGDHRHSALHHRRRLWRHGADRTAAARQRRGTTDSA
jgi:N-hydroxyarylamine O-acetyltransferase